MSLRNRIALAGGLVVLAALLLASLVLYPAADRDLHDQLDGQLVSAAAASPKLGAALKEKIAASGGVMSPTGLFDAGGTLMQFLPEPLEPGEAALAPVSDRDLAVAEGVQPAYFEDVKYQGQAYRVYTSLYGGGSGTVVRVARPLADTLSSLHRLQFLLGGLIVGGALAAAFSGRLLAGRVLRPVGRLTESVERVTATGDLSVRLDAGLTGTGGRGHTVGRDEIGRLARSFAGMMDALDDSVGAQRRLVADASHELRTPLTSLTTNLELLAEPGGLTDPQAPALARAALQQSGELSRLVNDLVDLARYGEPAAHTEEVRLDLVAQEVVARAARHAPRLRFAAPPPADPEACLVLADADALARALGNLVDNAAKWSPDGGRVTVTVAAEPTPGGEVDGGGVHGGGVHGGAVNGGGVDVVRCTVVDEGPGIAPDDLPHVFDRFYRATAARSKPGSGLGLSIVRQIAETYGGTVAALPAAHGARLRLELPRCGL